MTIYTIGHSTRAIDDFIEVLKSYRITQVADIRTVPRSLHNPQFNREALPGCLSGAGIGYEHVARLGGLRRPLPGSPNTGWRNASFRGFADYMGTPEFELGLADLLRLAERGTLAVMCAEAVPWRCHRSLVADALTVRGISVEHILGAGRNQKHALTPFACVEGTRVGCPLLHCGQ